MSVSSTHHVAFEPGIVKIGFPTQFGMIGHAHIVLVSDARNSPFGATQYLDARLKRLAEPRRPNEQGGHPFQFPKRARPPRRENSRADCRRRCVQWPQAGSRS